MPDQAWAQSHRQLPAVPADADRPRLQGGSSHDGRSAHEIVLRDEK